MVLYFGLSTAALLYLPGMIWFDNQVLDSYFRWWVVHLWVEGVWELIMGAILSFLLIKLTGVDREVIEKWLYVIVGSPSCRASSAPATTTTTSARPSYWLCRGRVCSRAGAARLPGHGLYGVSMARRGGRPPNRVALDVDRGCCGIMSFVGAGLLGFAHTLPQANIWTHGTLVTAMHGHLAFWGAYAMLVLAMISYAMPQMTGRALYRALDGRVGLLDLQHRHVGDDRRLRGGRDRPGLPRAQGGHGLPRSPGGH
jgi:nitric oxide reductase subunit B